MKDFLKQLGEAIILGMLAIWHAIGTIDLAYLNQFLATISTTVTIIYVTIQIRRTRRRKDEDPS